MRAPEAALEVVFFQRTFHKKFVVSVGTRPATTSVRLERKQPVWGSRESQSVCSEFEAAE
jgi:hypothetical protein